jgi:hypothetical protein
MRYVVEMVCVKTMKQSIIIAANSEEEAKELAEKHMQKQDMLVKEIKIIGAQG